MVKEIKKDWYKSKTIWVAFVTLVLAVLSAMGIPVPTEVYGILGALGLWGVRDAQGVKYSKE